MCDFDDVMKRESRISGNVLCVLRTLYDELKEILRIFLRISFIKLTSINIDNFAVNTKMIFELFFIIHPLAEIKNGFFEYFLEIDR